MVPRTLGSSRAMTDAGLPDAVMVGPVERVGLLDLARLALGVAVGGRSVDALDTALAAHRAAARTERRAAAFVTLSEGGELRGCIGILEPDELVADAVVTAAFSAARRDPRFEPVAARELPAITVEVSVLGPLVPLDDPLRFRLGVDGLVVERGRQRGLLLPEVATAAGLDRLAMLDATCRKAGLRVGAWREPGTSVRAFRTCRFGGPAVVTSEA
jgi:AmmeMemoRadiSam system protein A